MVYFCLIYYFGVCLDKFWKNYEVFIIIWSLFWKMLSFISVVVCPIEFNLALSTIWIIVLFWLNGCMKWHEFYRVDYSMYILFEVSFAEFKYCLCTELLISLQIMFDMLYKLFETYFVSLIKLSCDVNHVVLCSHRC